jgi:hypothetical protein
MVFHVTTFTNFLPSVFRVKLTYQVMDHRQRFSTRENSLRDTTSASPDHSVTMFYSSWSLIGGDRATIELRPLLLSRVW